MDAWIIWLVAALALGAGELHARSFFFAPLAAAALIATGASVAGVGLVLSAVIFVSVSALSLRAVRPLAALRQRGVPMALRTGTAALVGRRAIVLERIANGEGIGKVKIDGDLWTARSYDDDAVIGVGEVVEVVAIRGATAVVMT
jgi:membrane protein implicated in regulation of membrane protease activity